MKPLTRKILIEKKSSFWNYNSFNDVPDWLWEVACREMQNKPIKERLNDLAGRILCPLLKLKKYHIGEITNNHLWQNRNISVYNTVIDDFYLVGEDSVEFTVFYNDLYRIKSGERLKWFVFNCFDYNEIDI